MKQGTGKTTYKPATPHVATDVNIGHVSEMGAEQTRLHGKEPPLFGASKSEGPHGHVKVHHCGSQGKH